MIHVKVIFDRGTGLGNRLFPWSRSKTAFLNRHDINYLPVKWSHFRIGPLFKGGVSYSDFYKKILLFDNFIPDYSPLKPKSSDLEFDESNVKEAMQRKEDVVVKFQGIKDGFTPLYGHEEFLLKKIYSIVKPKYLNNALLKSDKPYISLNVRLARDFKPEYQTDQQWYMEALEFIQDKIGGYPLTYIITDGRSQDLLKLRAVKNVVFVKTNSAILDLLFLTKSKLIIGAGLSSFSAWGAFLGRSSLLCREGLSFRDFNLVEVSNQFIGSLFFDQPNEKLESVLKNITWK